jgi:hypothetical protein
MHILEEGAQSGGQASEIILVDGWSELHDR